MSKKRIRLVSLLLAILLTIGSLPVMPIFAEGELSLNVNVPFTSEVSFSAGGSTVTSNSFRIPAMVTLADGTIVAASDIRWNTTYDGGGLDTLVARSTDGGVSWSYVTANYLGDNGNVYNGTESTCFIDPCLTVAADGQTVYMLVDLYPYGVALNGTKDTAPSTEVGFTDDGNLKLSKNNSTSYGYYLKDGKIYSTAGVEESGYTVDEYFNLYYNGTKKSNLFFADSDYKVVRTGFLYLTKSTDGGASWSAPTLLDLKWSTEQVCLVAPGRGITTADGTMVFPVYSFHGDNEPSGNTQRMSFIYSTDGKNWSRTNEFNYNWASESAVIELESGDLRFFFRNGSTKLCYVDYDMDTKSWGSTVNTGITTNSNTQISAITYSKTSGGKQVVLVSCPAGPSGGSNQSGASYRCNGRIFVLTVDPDTGAVSLENTINVNNYNSSFMYSCLTERSDGSVAILFEDHENAWGTGSNCYYTMDMKAYSASSLGLTFDGDGGDEPDPDPSDPSEDYVITLDIGESYTVTVSDSQNVGTAGSYGTDSVEYTIAHVSQTGGTTVTKLTSISNGDTIVISDGTNYLKLNGTSITSTTDPAEATKWTVGVSGDYYTLKNGNYYLCPRSGRNSYNLNVVNSTTYNAWSFSSSRGFYYSNNYLYYSNGWSVARFVFSGYGAAYTVTQTEEIRSTKATFTAVSPTDGDYITIGDVVYKVIVNPKSAEKNVFLSIGSEKTLDAVADLGLSGDGYEVTYAVIEDTSSVIDSLVDGAVSAHAENCGSATLIATVKNGSGVTVGTVTYTVTVDAVEITDTKNIYVSEGYTATLEGLTGDILTSMLDTSIATVAPSEGALDNGEIVITGVSRGSTSVVVGTVKFNIYVNPRNTGSGAGTVKYIYIYVDSIEHCSVYYAINGGDLLKVEQPGVLIGLGENDDDYQEFTDGFNIIFFAAPESGYALTQMVINNSNGDYYCLADGTRADGSDSSAWPLEDKDATVVPTDADAWKDGTGSNNHGFKWCLLEGNMTIEGMRDLFTRALDDSIRAHGATTLTKNNKGERYSTHASFIAQRLPTVEKSIAKVERDGVEIEYNEDTRLRFGDVVTYRFTVNTYSEGVKYTEIDLHDDKIGYRNLISDGTLDAAGQTLTYTAEYTINVDDSDYYADGRFLNEAHLSLVYKSDYSNGTVEATASASVSCRISGIVYYTWMEGLPDGITGDSANYPRPTYEIVQYGGTVTVKEYTGNRSYSVIDANGNVTGVWSFEGWQYNGTDHAAGATLPMPINDNVAFVGIWNYEASPTYRVIYQWSNAPSSAILPTDGSEYYSGEKFTVDPTYAAGTQIDMGELTYTFGGWKLDGVTVSGEQTIADADAVLVGSWISNANVTSLVISKKTVDSRGNRTDHSSLDVNQTFMFRITGDDGVDITVTVHGNSSVTVDGLTVGNEYTVTEITEWSWRYSYAGYETGLESQTAENGAQVTLGITDNSIVFLNQRSQSKWLDGDSWLDNIFDLITGA